jgi:Zn-dependent M28 family amino/carboxypeptidase
MRSRSFMLISLVLSASLGAAAQQRPDAATAAWWAQTTTLANDSMEGRDTGTAAYERAAKYVADQFRTAGLKPAGSDGTYFQRVPMVQTDLDTAHSGIEITYEGSDATTPLTLLEEVTLVPRAYTDLAPASAGMVFVGYGNLAPEELASLSGKIAVLFNNAPATLSAAERNKLIASRAASLTHAGVVAIVSIDNPAAIEPTHWPAAYARSVVLSPPPVHRTSDGPLQFRISAEAAPKLFAASSHHFADLLHDGEKGAPLPTFALHASLRIHLTTTQKDISSPNVLAILPGSNPQLSGEFVAVSAHLDGYGYGTSVLGDKLYNGALDDAAYVATLLELAKSLRGKAPARSLLFCIFTGEEKGLLGSAYFTAHPTLPIPQIVADLNLDQLRPIFALRILTMEGIDDSTLGATVKTLAQSFRIEIRPDHEPERNLFRRSDNYNFVRVGVPIASFIFGYDPGSPEERIYRDWYARRYHKPQDDLKTPIDWKAAGTFNAFYGQLAVAIANDAKRPTWLPASLYAPKP